MEITQEEYLELQNKLAELQKQVNDMTKKPRNTFAGLVAEMPIDRITIDNYKDRRTEVAEYDSTSGDAWLLFVKLAKLIHQKEYYYIAERAIGPCKGWLRQHGKREVPTRIDQLSIEQLKTSINMLDEMVAIYNKYFKSIHTGVYVNNLHDEPGKFRFVEVSDSQKAEIKTITVPRVVFKAEHSLADVLKEIEFYRKQTNGGRP